MAEGQTKPTHELAEEFFGKPIYLKHARYLIEYRAMLILGALGHQRPARILDVGCGDGTLSIGLLNEAAHLTLLDLSGSMLDQARQRVPPRFAGNVRFELESFVTWDTDETFDTVLCVGVLAHVPSIEEFVAKIAALLRPGGTAVLEVTVPRRRVLPRLAEWLRTRRLRPQVQPGYATNLISVAELLAVAAKAGLVEVMTFRYNIYVPLARFLPQWLLRFILRQSSEGRVLSRYATENMIFLMKGPV